jgi:hypothetical protein
MAVTVRRTTSHLDAWETIRGETRWIDYSCQEVHGVLTVYAHLFRRVRDRLDDSRDVLFWKPATTKVAQQYPAGEWAAVVHDERAWPPVGVEPVPRRSRHRATG